MLTNPTLRQLQKLRLDGMAAAYASQLEQADIGSLDFDDTKRQGNQHFGVVGVFDLILDVDDATAKLGQAEVVERRVLM